MVIFLAAFSVVMVGMAALVIDVGSILDEKRQLQNGADAGALAVAQSCALGGCRPELAAPLANSNSKDLASAADTPSINMSTKQVTVTTRTRTGGTSILPYSFGQILTGIAGKEVTAKSTAQWAPLGRAVVMRLAISQCDVLRLGISTVPRTIYFHSASSACDKGGKDASGAFGWLDDDRPPTGNTCELTVTAGQTASADPGNSGPTACLDPYFPMDILLPVFDDVRGIQGTGTNATYLIKGFARFRLTGYRFAGAKTDASSINPPCGGSDSCIRGYFVKYVTTTETTTTGGTDFGVSTVKLVS